MARHSPMVFDFKRLSVKFQKEDQAVELFGLGNEVKLKMLKGNRMKKWLRKQAY